MTDEEIVSSYVEYVDRIPLFLPPTSREELEVAVSAIREAADQNDFFWAWEAVMELVDTDPERAWRTLLEALARCAPHREFSIGAGPLEELLIRQPRLFARRVASELLVNPRFRAAFSVIHFSTEYTTVEDANNFSHTLASGGVAPDLIPIWRVDEPDQEV